MNVLEGHDHEGPAQHILPTRLQEINFTFEYVNHELIVRCDVEAGHICQLGRLGARNRRKHKKKKKKSEDTERKREMFGKRYNNLVALVTTSAICHLLAA